MLIIFLLSRYPRPPKQGIAFQIHVLFFFAAYWNQLYIVFYGHGAIYCNMWNLLVVNPQSKRIPTTSVAIDFQEIPSQSQNHGSLSSLYSCIFKCFDFT